MSPRNQGVQFRLKSSFGFFCATGNALEIKTEWRKLGQFSDPFSQHSHRVKKNEDKRKEIIDKRKTTRG